MVLFEGKSLGKRFGRSWIFKNLDLTIQPGDRIAVLGSNGSGKSTLLKIIAGFERPSKGEVAQLDPKPEFGFSAPWSDLYEDLSLVQLFELHTSFRSFPMQLDPFLDKCWLTEHKLKAFSSLSSGMKQRFKLGLALWGNEPLVLLDEPTSNLDVDGKEWYKEQLGSSPKDKAVLVATNEPIFDTDSSFRRLAIADYKQ